MGIFNWVRPAPDPPFYTVIFTATLNDIDVAEYRARSSALTEKVRRLPGFLGEDAVVTQEGEMISVSYWDGLEAIQQWSADIEHRQAKHLGRTVYFKTFDIRIARIDSVSSNLRSTTTKDG